MIQPVQATASIAPVAPIQPVAWPLPAMTQGISVTATVVARLTTGEVRVSLLGQLLDLMPSVEASSALAVGDTVTLSVLSSGQQPVLSIVRVDRPASKPPLAESLAADGAQPDDGLDGGAVEVGVGAARPSASRPMDAQALSQARVAGVEAGAEAPPNEVAREAGPPTPAALRAAVAAALPGAAAVQTGLAPLLADADALTSAGEAVPEPVRAALQTLAATGLDAGKLTGASLKEAVAQSGVFHESSALRPQGQFTAAPDEARPATLAAASSDLKTVLFALRAAIRAWSDTVQAPPIAAPEPTEQRFQARKAPEAAQASSPRAQTSSPAIVPHLPPPTRAITTFAQPAGYASVDATASPVDVARTVLADVEGAIGRVTLLQASALADAPGQPATASSGSRPFDLAVEIPLRLPGQTPVLSLAIGHDDERRPSASPLSPAQRAWKMQLSLDLDPAGPLHALVRLRGRGAGVTLWAERPETVSLFQLGLPVLRDALHAADLDVDSLEVLPGSPPQPRPVPAGSLLDRRS